MQEARCKQWPGVSDGVAARDPVFLVLCQHCRSDSQLETSAWVGGDKASVLEPAATTAQTQSRHGTYRPSSVSA